MEVPAWQGYTSNIPLIGLCALSGVLTVARTVGLISSLFPSPPLFPLPPSTGNIGLSLEQPAKIAAVNAARKIVFFIIRVNCLGYDSPL